MGHVKFTRDDRNEQRCLYYSFITRFTRNSTDFPGNAPKNFTLSRLKKKFINVQPKFSRFLQFPDIISLIRAGFPRNFSPNLKKVHVNFT